MISQDQIIQPNPGVVNGSYDETTKTFSRESGDYIIFSIGHIHLLAINITITDDKGNVIQSDQDPQLWKFWYAGDNEDNTVLQFNQDSSWSGATFHIQGVEGYWPITFNIVLS